MGRGVFGVEMMWEERQKGNMDQFVFRIIFALLFLLAGFCWRLGEERCGGCSDMMERKERMMGIRGNTGSTADDEGVTLRL